MKKRVLAVLLSMVMTATMFSGCGDSVETGGRAETETGGIETEVKDLSPMDPDIESETTSTDEGDSTDFLTGYYEVDFLEAAKRLKAQVRENNKEDLLAIINNEGLSEEQKRAAVDALVEMETWVYMELDLEILLAAKGFSDVMVTISGDAVDVLVVYTTELDEDMTAQIKDIVERKTGILAENISIIEHISDNKDE